MRISLRNTYGMSSNQNNTVDIENVLKTHGHCLPIWMLALWKYILRTRQARISTIAIRSGTELDRMNSIHCDETNTPRRDPPKLLPAFPNSDSFRMEKH